MAAQNISTIQESPAATTASWIISPILTPATAVSPVRAPCVRLVPTMSATFGPGVATSRLEATTKTR